MYKYLLGILLSWLLFSFSFANIDFLPHYSDARFPPSDAFHAGCQQTIDIKFSLTESATLNVLNAVIQYNPDELTIDKIVPEKEKELNLAYLIQENKIMLTKLKGDTTKADTVTFSLTFTPKSNSSHLAFRFVDGSYILDNLGKMVSLDGTYDFSVAEVPECNPDIIPPTVNVIYPVTWTQLPLDSYFVFDLKDEGKGINKDAIVITIDGVPYTSVFDGLTWEKNKLKFVPDMRLPMDKDIKITFKVADKQVYWWANITEKTFTFHTATWFDLLNPVDIKDFRLFSSTLQSLQWSLRECNLLENIYHYVLPRHQELLLSIGKRIRCDKILSGFAMWAFAVSMPQKSLFPAIEPQKKWISVFAFLWWFLFVVSLWLKTFYIYRNHKHRKIVKKHGLA